MTWKLQTGLFSAAVAALLALSVPIIQLGSQDIAAFYLAQIHQELSTQPNGTKPSIPSSLSDPTQTYTPPTSGVWVNGLWFMSLVISLTCALLATMVQQWARRYQRVAYPRCSPHKKARIRAFYKRGVEELRIPWAIEVLPALLHISLFLFFAGLSVFLFSVHLTIFKVVTSWIASCVILYACLTFLPIIRKDSPYSAPLSASVSFCLTGIRHLVFQVLQKYPDIESALCTPLRRNDQGAVHLEDFFSHSMTKTAEKYAHKLPPNIDHTSLLWTFESLDEDTDLEKFFEGLPRLCDSETGKELKLQEGFIIPYKKKLSSVLIELMNRTLSSNLVTEFVKQRRMIICTKAIESTSLLGPWWILRCVLLGDWYRFLGCIEFGLFVQNWKSISHPVTTFYAQCVAAYTISIVRRDERRIQLASDLLKDSPLRKYVAKDTKGDSIELANAIFIIRRTIQTYSGAAERHRKDILHASSRTLEAVCKLDIGSTSPELQNEFCGLWNQLVDAARTGHRVQDVLVSTLKNIRKLYIALHDAGSTAFYTTTDDQDLVWDKPMSYPMCTIAHHYLSKIPELIFDDPAPDSDPPPTPNFMPMPTPTFHYPPAPPPTFSSYHTSPSAPYRTVPAQFHPRGAYGSPFVDTQSHLAALPDSAVHFPVPQLANPDTLNVPPGGNVRSQPSPPPKSTSPVSSIQLDASNVFNQGC